MDNEEQVEARRAAAGTPRLSARKARRKSPRKVMLALQGGGAHSAFGWGALEHLLDLQDEGEIDITAISGTSGGAINAVLLAHGLQDSTTRAREILQQFWTMNARAGMWSPFSLPAPVFGSWNIDSFPWVIGLNSMNLLLSPYQLPPSANPLLATLEACVNFERLRTEGSGPEVFVVATNARAGRFKAFGKESIRADHVLASACLPTVFRGVVLDDGDIYWDGGYLKDPGISPLLYSAKKTPALHVDAGDQDDGGIDVIIVGINPISRSKPFFPMSSWEIADRLNELCFNSSLQAEVEKIELVNKWIKAVAKSKGEVDDKEVGQKRPVHLHYLSPSDEIEKLGLASKSNVSQHFVEFLRNSGEETAADWWANSCLPNLGVRHTDIDKIVD